MSIVAREQAGAITAPAGFRAAAMAAGIKPQGLDLTLLAAERSCPAAAVFTRSRAQAAPVRVTREHLSRGGLRAVVVNAGCANAATGARGEADARETAALVAAALDCSASEIAVASTGVIGVQLPMEKLRAGVAALAPALSAGAGAEAARAIMTTDTRPKEALAEFALEGATVRVAGMAKGAGMIAPNMATLLAFFTTDARIERSLLQRALREAVDASLNRITVDGDTSTNDMALVLASGASGAREVTRGPDLRLFREALTAVAKALALMIVRDGEGATRVAEVRVEGAASAYVADRAARTIAESPLFKTALHGGDPNWGRVLAALGRSGVHFDADAVDIFLGDVWVCEHGQARAYDDARAHAAMIEDPCLVRIVLHQGTAAGSIWTCDFSKDYVSINAHYRS